MTAFEKIMSTYYKGNRYCYKSLYEMYFNPGMTIGMSYTRNEKEALELFNKSFVRMISKLHKNQSKSEFERNFKNILQKMGTKYQKSQIEKTNVSKYSVLRTIFSPDRSRIFYKTEQLSFPMGKSKIRTQNSKSNY